MVRKLAIHAKEVTNFAATHADVACGNVFVRTDVTIQFGHESLAETHDFSIAAPAGCKVATTLTAAHRQRGKCVFERLLEAQELQDREVYRGMETQSAFVWANSAVELHAITDVNVYLALIVGPRNTEGDDAFGLYHPLDNFSFFKLRVLIVHILN